MQTIAFRMLGDDLMVFMCGRSSPTEHEWHDYLRVLEEAAGRARSSGGTLRFFIFVDEGAPNAKQRAAVVDALRGLPTLISVITTSKLARHLITVFGWLGLTIRGFAPNQLEAATEYLALPAAHLSQIIEVGSNLAPTLGGVSSFEEATSTAPVTTRRA